MHVLALGGISEALQDHITSFEGSIHWIDLVNVLRNTLVKHARDFRLMRAVKPRWHEIWRNGGLAD